MSHNDLNRGHFLMGKIMIPLFLGTKKIQSQEFTPEGERVPVTLVAAGPCYVTAIRETNGGKEVEIGFGITRSVSRARAGHIKKSGLDKKLRFLKSFRATDVPEGIAPGSEIQLENVLSVGDTISITGTSKGKGFAGVVKRHHFKGGPRTHGQSDRERSPGSIGQTTTPGRVYRGKRMAGRMGSDTVTVRNLKVFRIENGNTLVVRGLVPGPKDGLLVIRKR